MLSKRNTVTGVGVHIDGCGPSVSDDSNTNSTQIVKRTNHFHLKTFPNHNVVQPFTRERRIRQHRRPWGSTPPNRPTSRRHRCRTRHLSSGRPRKPAELASMAEMVHRDCHHVNRPHSQLHSIWLFARRQEVRQGLWGVRYSWHRGTELVCTGIRLRADDFGTLIRV